ncbi:MAG: DEAD/DEAH box helicase family protein, partial [Eubacteriales bacterium]
MYTRIIQLNDELKPLYLKGLNSNGVSRDYQLDTLAKLKYTREIGEKSAYFVYATGGGKTTVAALDIVSFARDFKAQHGREPRVLWIAHHHELLEQAEEDINAKQNNLIEDELEQ